MKFALILFFQWMIPWIGWARVWITAEGSRAEGELVEVRGDRIGLEINGREYHFSLQRFSQKDQAYVRQWAKSPRCSICTDILGTNRMKAGEDEFHPDCFRCMVCREVFADGESFQRDDWGGMVHVNHSHFTSTCGSCSKLFLTRQARPRQIFKDGRTSCSNCLDDGVFKENLLEEVLRRVRPVLLELGISKPRGKLSLELVDRSFLNREALRINAVGNLRGLTLTKYKLIKGGRNPGISFDHKIYVLFGLPYVECVSVVAHELAHVWLNERFIEDSPPVIEGFCNLVAEHALEKEKSKLASLIRENMDLSKNPIYGAGYRRMKMKLSQIGWPALLTFLKKKSTPP